MKKCRSLLSAFMAVVFAMMCIGLNASLSVSAAGEYTITINPGDSLEHTYKAYQLFSGDVSTTGKLSNIDWGFNVPSDRAGILTAIKAVDGFSSCATPEDIANVLSGLIDDTGTDDDTIAANAVKEKTRFDFAKAVAPKLTADSPLAFTQSGSNYVCSVDKDKAGYYLIKESTETPANNTTTETAYTAYVLKVVGTVSFSPKKEVPTLTKTIGESAKENTAAIGDTVNYRIKVTVPKDVKNHYSSYKLVITDTLSKGLTYNNDPKIYIGSIATANIYAATNYTVGLKDKDGGTTIPTPPTKDTVITITISDIYEKLEQNAATDIYVTYSATLNVNADITSGNTNKAYLNYSNNPANDSMGKTPEDTVTTYTTGIVIFKYTGDSKTPLTGAEFTLTPYEDDEGDTDVTLSKAAVRDKVSYSAFEEREVVDGGISGYVIEPIDGADPAVDENDKGYLYINGLKEGTYTITESVTPDGYNTISPIKLKISKKSNGTGWDWNYTVDGTDKSTDNKIEIQNNEGIVLPATGGIGTTIFYIAGGSIMILAGILFVTKKIVDSREKKNR